MSKYITVGTIKTIDLSNHTFTIEPIFAYRFQTKDDDENSWKIVFKEEIEDPNELKLVKRGEKFVFDEKLASVLVVLKENKTKITVKVEQLIVSETDDALKNQDVLGDKIKDAVNDSRIVEIGIQ